MLEAFGDKNCISISVSLRVSHHMSEWDPFQIRAQRPFDHYQGTTSSSTDRMFPELGHAFRYHVLGKHRARLQRYSREIDTWECSTKLARIREELNFFIGESLPPRASPITWEFEVYEKHALSTCELDPRSQVAF